VSRRGQGRGRQGDTSQQTTVALRAAHGDLLVAFEQRTSARKANAEAAAAVQAKARAEFTSVCLYLREICEKLLV